MSSEQKLESRSELVHTRTSNGSIMITSKRSRRLWFSPQLQRLDPIHNQGLRIAFGAFCICKTNNLLCEAGMANLSSKRAFKAATTAIRVAVMLRLLLELEDAETYDWYATKTIHTKPFFIRAVGACALLSIQMQKVDVMVRRQQSPWMTNTGHQIITTLCALLKGSGTESIEAEMRQVIEDKGLKWITKREEGGLRSGFAHRYTEMPIATPNNDFQYRNVYDLESH
jgi:hypothetical protein